MSIAGKMSDDPYREVGVNDPFHGISADFYEQIQLLKAEIERLSEKLGASGAQLKILSVEIARLKEERN